MVATRIENLFTFSNASGYHFQTFRHKFFHIGHVIAPPFIYAYMKIAKQPSTALRFSRTPAS
jgi:hypothetical protein